MTATPILEALAHDFSTSVDHVRNALEMIDAGLSSPFIGRFRRPQVGSLSESLVRRMARRRDELEELDRRRGTIIRLLEREEETSDDVLAPIRECLDRFELEDLFLPHRRPEPEVQLALDRGLGALADQLVASASKERGARKDKEKGLENEEGTPDEAPEASAPPTEADAAPPAEPAPDAPPEPAPCETQPGACAEPAPAASAEAQPVGAEVTEPAPSGDAAQASEASSSPEPATGPATEPATPGEATPAVEEQAAAGKTDDPRPAAPIHRVLTPQLAKLCAPYVQPDRGIHTESEALAGAMRILSDRLGRDPKLRGSIRHLLRKHGVLTVRPTVDESKAGRHRSLFKARQPLRQIQGHRLLALRQAQKERVLNTVIELDPKRALPRLRSALGKHADEAYQGVLDEIAHQALNHRLLPMVEQDVRLELKERGDQEALRFLSQHLRQILLTPPLGRHAVVGVDVNAKGDWTLVPLDADGGPSGEAVRVEVGEKDAAALGAELASVVSEDCRGVAVGHGKGPRSAVTRIRAALGAAGRRATVYIVNEAGLSSYANSQLARAELADHSVPQRMAISLGRRLQDPMTEILKVDPRHLGLGSEQGLVSKANVRRVFAETIESCVAHVGCDLNRAPLSVLRHLPGLDAGTAQKLIDHRTKTPFTSREELRHEGLLTEAQWTSAVAFLRIYGGSSPLDATSLHPEQYPFVHRVLEAAGTSVEDGLRRPGVTKGLKRGDFDLDDSTWRDLMREISFPGRDPRPRLAFPDLLAPDTDPARIVKDRVVEGVVSNVASFGAFVDIGLPQDAMLHISEVSSHYVRDVRELLSIGQVVRARILDGSGPRISLSMKNVPAPERARGRGRRGREGGDRGDRGDRGGRGGRGGRGRPESPNVRAAQSRRDGLAGSSSGRGGRGGGGGGGRRGPGRGPGDRRERFDSDDRVDLKKINQAGRGYSPFASFFKEKSGEDVEGGPRAATPEPAQEPSTQPSALPPEAPREVSEEPAVPEREPEPQGGPEPQGEPEPRSDPEPEPAEAKTAEKDGES